MNVLKLISCILIQYILLFAHINAFSMYDLKLDYVFLFQQSKNIFNQCYQESPVKTVSISVISTYLFLTILCYSFKKTVRIIKKIYRDQQYLKQKKYRKMAKTMMGMIRKCINTYISLCHRVKDNIIDAEKITVNVKKSTENTHTIFKTLAKEAEHIDAKVKKNNQKSNNIRHTSKQVVKKTEEIKEGIEIIINDRMNTRIFCKQMMDHYSKQHFVPLHVDDVSLQIQNCAQNIKDSAPYIDTMLSVNEDTINHLKKPIIDLESAKIPSKKFQMSYQIPYEEKV